MKLRKNIGLLAVFAIMQSEAALLSSRPARSQDMALDATAAELADDMSAFGYKTTWLCRWGQVRVASLEPRFIRLRKIIPLTS